MTAELSRPADGSSCHYPAPAPPAVPGELRVLSRYQRDENAGDLSVAQRKAVPELGVALSSVGFSVFLLSSFPHVCMLRAVAMAKPCFDLWRLLQKLFPLSWQLCGGQRSCPSCYSDCPRPRTEHLRTWVWPCGRGLGTKRGCSCLWGGVLSCSAAGSCPVQVALSSRDSENLLFTTSPEATFVCDGDGSWGLPDTHVPRAHGFRQPSESLEAWLLACVFHEPVSCTGWIITTS